jgi:pimeloyl-ACP methyl ester carboxylesterase
MDRVTSKDGTTIVYDRLGEGPAVVLVCGGSVDRQSNAGLAEQLAQHFTVYNYERRGRGESGDTPPYTIDREIEDIEAVIDRAGGSAYLYGISSGAVLALDATSQLPSKVKKLAMYEPPFIVEGSRPRPPADTAAIYNKMVSEGRRGDAVEYFMTTVVGMPAEFAAQARNEPWWPWQEGLAHTLAYDATVMGDYSLPAERAASVKVPTLVINGGATFDWLSTSNQAFAKLLPNGQYEVIEGQSHDVSPAALAPVLEKFFSS